MYGGDRRQTHPRFLGQLSPKTSAGLAAEGVPDDVVGLLDFLFNEVLDGRNQSTADGVRRALGREPRDFADFAREAAAKGAWDA